MGMPMSSYIETYPSGTEFCPLVPRKEDVSIEDIAHALSHICRFNGHIKRHYSVAEHSYHASFRVSDRDDTDLALCLLLHDAAEAYIGDVTRPLKHALYVLGRNSMMEKFSEVEARLHEVIWEALVGGSSFDYHREFVDRYEQIHEVDNRMLVTEAVQLIRPAAWIERMRKKYPPYRINLREPLPDVRRSFLKRFRDLTR